MKIPATLEAAYRDNHNLNSFVSQTVAAVEAHLRSNSMVFFPEYTDHGLSHLELTLQTAIDLATTETRKLISAHDAAALVVAVCLHDFGMYLTRDGFLSLVAANSRWRGVASLDNKSWADLWADFYAEASRFDGRKLKSLFGENYRPVRPLPTDRTRWEEFDILLIGEFLRRHHPRLAHEIAIYGMPAKDGASIEVCPSRSEDQKFLAGISGLVARSHGMDLRTCIDFLDNEHNNKIDPRRVKAIFLAVLLRIADYFQLQSTRAPTARTAVSSFTSGLSESEWRVHQSVTDIHNTGSDPESIVIDASPPDVESFLKLKTWIKGIQEELDKSWAVLGEVFGLQSHNDLNKMGLKIRRIRSNLDDVEKFSKTVEYVPAKISFETANADLLKLLVAPLYGEDPGIGIRELFQNSIDAVREFDDLASRNPNIANVDRYPLNADVVLEIDADEHGLPTFITVTDRGVGMTPEIIREYFLKAGASFRKSNSWKREHEDSEGKSRVFRTGRFGVGALAAFLLGDEIEVTSRHALSPPDDAINFSAKLDDEFVSLVRTSAPVGTQIRIKIPERLQTPIKNMTPKNWSEYLYFSSSVGHYFLKTPSVRRILPGWDKEILPRYYLPQPEDGNSSIWRSFETSHIEKIFWTYSHEFPRLASNGIVISVDSDPTIQPGGIFKRPNISAFDRNGYLPVNLQRTGLQTYSLPFDKELEESIAIDLLAYALVEAPSRIGESGWFDGHYPGFVRFGHQYEANRWAHWWLGKQGFIFNDRVLLKRLNPTSVIVSIGGKEGYAEWGNDLLPHIEENMLLASFMPKYLSDQNHRIKGIFQQILRGTLGHYQQFNYRPIQAFIPKTLVEKIQRMGPGQSVRNDIEKFKGLSDKSDWYQLDFQKPSGNFRFSQHLPSLSRLETLTSFMIIEIDDWNADERETAVSRLWESELKQTLLPFELKQREKVEKGTSALLREIAALRRKAPRFREKDDESS